MWHMISMLAENGKLNEFHEGRYKTNHSLW